ncbi:MAG: GvpL/GvpF family gas vesicle protein [Elusimicrobia bacterium]|nr:GvpL/GvpF family gas vesicle protein [Elusimicrobiota bacterium]
MEKEGKYIYCVIATPQERTFRAAGIGGVAGVFTCGCDDLSMVVSGCPVARLVVSMENMLAHQRVIEEVMKEFDSVLPVRFGTIAAGVDEIRSLLAGRYGEFKNALREMDHKVELGVKGAWKNMDALFKEIVNGNKALKQAREAILNDRNKKNIRAKMEAGRMLADALAHKKAAEAEKIVDALRRTAFDYKPNKTVGDAMFVNAAFLVDKGRGKEFDNIMDELSEAHKDKIKFAYAGPLPVFNFVNLAIYPQEWEK